MKPLELYKTMLTIRLAEERVAAIYPTDKIQSPIHLSLGQEAVCTGVCAALRPNDRLYGTYRGHGLYIAKGGDLGRMFAELYGKDTGCARGKGGSMHLAAPEQGLMACSAIVASTIPVAVGDALAAQAEGRDRLVVAFFGDGAVDEGVFYESVNFAVLKNLPILFVCENNQYAIHSRVADRRKVTDLHRIGAGLGLKGRRFDGNDAGAVLRATAAAAKSIRAGGAPQLLEFMTYRWVEHVGANTDYQEAYRFPGEEKKARAADPVSRAKKKLGKAADAVHAEVVAAVDAAVAFAERSPFPAVDQLLSHVYAPAPIAAPAADPTETIRYGEALRRATEHVLATDPTSIVMGIGVDDHRAVFGTTKGLLARFGKQRVFDTPIAEGAIGAALGGLKPIHIHIRTDFLYLAMDQLLNMAAKWRSMYGGTMSVPMVVRAVIGRSWGQGAQHSQSLQALFAHVPGIKVGMPTTPADAQDLLLAAVADPNPVLLIEHRLLYDLEGPVARPGRAGAFLRTVTRRRGKDLTIVANSYMAVEALKAAEFLSTQGVECEVVDPVTIVPLDEQPILDSVRKTGRLLVVDTSWTSCGVSAEVAARVSERAFEALKGPVRRLGMQPAPCPVSKPLENAFYPDAASIATTALEMLGRGAPDLRAPALTNRFKGPF